MHARLRLVSCLGVLLESLVPDGTTPTQGSLEDDLDKLQSILHDDIPAYVVARLDTAPASWLLIDYVPDSAKVRDKVGLNTI